MYSVFFVIATVILTVLGSAEQTPYFVAPGWSRANPYIRLNVPESDNNQWNLYSVYAFDPKILKPIENYQKVASSDLNDYFDVVGSK